MTPATFTFEIEGGEFLSPSDLKAIQRVAQCCLSVEGVERPCCAYLLLTDDEELDLEYIDVEKSLPVAFEGIVALETRTEGKAHDAAMTLSDHDTMIMLGAERAFVRSLGIGREDAATAFSVINSGKLFMKVMIRNGQKCVYFAGMDNPENGEQLAEQLADKVRNMTHK